MDSTALAETSWVGFCHLLQSGVFPSLSHSNVDGVMIITHMSGKTKVSWFGEISLPGLFLQVSADVMTHYTLLPVDRDAP